MASTAQREGPAATAIAPGPVSENLTQGNQNMQTHTTAPADPASEHPATKSTRLARELSKTLAEDTDGGVTVAVVYPAGSLDYPLMFCYGDDFAAVTSAAFKYRAACRALAECGGKGVRRLKAARDAAHAALLASFEVQS